MKEEELIRSIHERLDEYIESGPIVKEETIYEHIRKIIKLLEYYQYQDPDFVFPTGNIIGIDATLFNGKCYNIYQDDDLSFKVREENYKMNIDVDKTDEEEEEMEEYSIAEEVISFVRFLNNHNIEIKKVDENLLSLRVSNGYSDTNDKFECLLQYNSNRIKLYTRQDL